MTAIAMISIGRRPWVGITYPTLCSYAQSIGATPILLNCLPEPHDFPFRSMPDSPGRGNKIAFGLKAYYAGKLLDKYDKVMIVDDSCIFANNSFDIFSLHQKGHVAAIREPTLRGDRTREAEENRMFDYIDRFTWSENRPNINRDRSRYINSGVVIYDQNSKVCLNAENILEAQALLFSDFPHQTLLYYLLAKFDIPVQILPPEYNDINIFEIHREKANLLETPLSGSFIYHATGWWRDRPMILALIIEKLRKENRLTIG